MIPPEAYARLAKIAWVHAPAEDGEGEEDEDTIGRYRILERLGAGSAGVVFRAVNPEGQEVAIKLLRRRRSRSSRYMRELELLERTAERAGVVALLDAGRCPRGPFLVLELAVGGSLRTLLNREKRLPWQRATALLLEVAQSLAALHEEGIIHRDLKPENILLQADRPLISDFGLAKDLGDADGELTSAGIAMGTIGYMSPELLDGNRDQLGPWTDVFALGSLLYELIAGRPPFGGKNLREAARSVREGEVSELPGTPSAITAIVRRCLEKDPTRRYEQAGELALALVRALHDEGAPTPD
ncbi:MAG: serine/threonine protein kinase [Planctomycetes bacterium]|nr:serine/threonine protein kinase [Planctomycetota bacterium]